VASDKDDAGRWRRLYEKAAQFLFRDLWHWDRSRGSRFHSILVFHIRLAFLVIRGCREHRWTTRAAALTFTTVFGLIPFLAVALSLMSAFADLEQHEDRVIQFVVERFIPRVAPKRRAGPATTTEPAGTSQDPEDLRRSVREKVKHFIGNVQHGRIGAAASALCVVIFFHLLASIEAAFNHIWGVRSNRTFLRKLSAYWMLLIVPVIIAGYAAVVTRVDDWLASAPLLAWGFGLLTEVGFVWLVFLALYWLLPNTRVRFAAAAWGALWGALLVWLVKESTLLVALLFGHRAETLAQIYGASVAVIPMFLLIVYVLWLIALFGAEWSYAFQNVRSYARDRRTAGLNQESREAFGLRLLAEVAARFARGEPPPTTAALSDRFDLSQTLVRDTLERFEEGGLIRRAGEGPDAVWQPARPLDRVGLEAALDCLRRENGEARNLGERDPMSRRLGEWMGSAEAGARSAFEGRTLADLVEESGEAGPAQSE
jgi:membrane protein